MIRAYVLTDDEVDHSDTLLWSRVQEQRVERVAPSVCAHDEPLDAPCVACRSEGTRIRLVRLTF